MRNQNTVLESLLKALPRRVFGGIVERHRGDRYIKEFSSWDHLVALVFAQLDRIGSLRELAAVWNAQDSHYHLGRGRVHRSTLADANRRRPAAIFAETFVALSARAAAALPRHGRQLVRLIDTSPIPLGSLCRWAQWNGRTRGLKLHLLYDPDSDHPLRLAITPANVNDVVVGREMPLEAGATYVFDKAYVDYRWWHRLHLAGCRFVTRPKSNVPFTLIKQRRLGQADRAAAIDSDSLVELASQQHGQLPVRLRRIVRRRDDGTRLTLISNDLTSTAHQIAALYKMRWQIELLFRWIKQHLKITSFLGRSENAIRLQLLAAMIAYLLLRLAARESRSTLPELRFADLVRTHLFRRRTLAPLDRPPPLPPPDPPDASQLKFGYA